MQKKKETKVKLQIIFSALLLSVVFIAEFYAIVNYPKQYIFIAIFAVLFLVVLYILINGLFMMQLIKNERREEQYDNIFKSEKASYLMLKKYFEKIDDKIDILMTTAKVPTEEIINAQKGVAKVIINRSRENAEALMNSNDMLIDKLDTFEEKLSSNNDGLLQNQKSIVEDNYNQLLIKQQELAASLKDMELRLNQAIIQTQQSINSQPVQLTAKVDIPQQPVTLQMPAMQIAQPMITSPGMYTQQPVAPITEPEVKLEPVVEAEPIVELDPVVEAQSVVEPEPVVEAEPVVEPEPVVEAEPVAEPEPVVEAEPVVEPEPVAEPEPVIESEPIVEPEPIMEQAPAVDLSDPNKKMNPDEIAALIASMGAGESESVVESEPEPIVEPEPVEEEKPPMPDLSDPNRTLSPDEIAALIANI